MITVCGPTKRLAKHEKEKRKGRNQAMNPPQKIILEGKQILRFSCAETNAPVVYLHTYQEEGTAVLAQCEELNCPPFHLVSISGLRWEEELSPWPHPPVLSNRDHFTGEAEDYAACLTEKILPWAEKQLSPSCRILAGYSMGGLFALYAPFVTGAFSKVAAVSGSVWYPGFVPYVQSHQTVKPLQAVYLSLGKLEPRTRNRYLRQTEACMQALLDHYRQQAIPAVFESNPGNHFQDAPLRIAKGIAWTLNNAR